MYSYQMCFLIQSASRLSRIAAPIFLSSVKELEKFLSPEFLEEAILTDDAKADIIIAG